jgi:diketogulonate reductase-like aldo/keto reductase
LQIIIFLQPGTWCSSFKSDREARLFAFCELIKLKKNGLVQAIGVSNFLVSHLKQLFQDLKDIGIDENDFPSVRFFYYIK